MANESVAEIVFLIFAEVVRDVQSKKIAASTGIAKIFEVAATKQKRPAPICNGDGGESERLYGLGAGHVLTIQDVADIQNHIADYNDEIGNSVEIFHQAYQAALHDCAPDKQALVNKVSELEVEVTTQKAMRKFDEACEKSAVGDRSANPASTA